MPLTEPTDQPPRWLRTALHPPPWPLDIALAAFLALIALASGLARVQTNVVGTLIIAGAAIALIWRRKWPLGVFVVACAAYVVDSIISTRLGTGEPAIAVATYTLVQRTSGREAFGVTAVAAAAVLFADNLEGGTRLYRSIPSVVILAAATMLGLLVAERRRERERERGLLAGQAAAEERVRLARELHDIVAHHLSVIVLQANVLTDSLGEESPARAIRDSGREALAEMRRVLQVLRTPDAPDGDSRGPQPGLGDLGALIERVTAAGLTVEVKTEGEPRELPAAADLSAYRILQEALTNVLRHAQASRATVRVAYTAQAVELEVIDDGVGPPTAQGPAVGHGLEGMAERAALFGGEIEWGPATGRGYRLQAVLPV
ncbi:MAG TPA: sensor histidine kinase [Solirubrobacteraceae bacterium]|nr:sensor histidine kinase [Solirubrobacteraceae bacterium]